MKSYNLSRILRVILKCGADVSFYSSLDDGVCFLMIINGRVFSTVLRNEGDLCTIYTVHDLYDWVSARKDDVEHFVLYGSI